MDLTEVIAIAKTLRPSHWKTRVKHEISYSYAGGYFNTYSIIYGLGEEEITGGRGSSWIEALIAAGWKE